jgi:hypothetical protein
MSQNLSPATPAAASEPQTITLPTTPWVAIITHDHGTNVTVAATEALAMEAVADFADYWWDDEMDGRERPTGPEDRSDLVAEYFEARSDCESYLVMKANTCA